MSDRKDAVNIGVTLSTQLIAAALAMIAIVGTFTAFVMDKREVDHLYHILTISSFLSFVISIYHGGKGIDRARKDGFVKRWNLVNTKSSFNKQAGFCFLGIILFIISVFFCKEKKDNSKQDIDNLKFKVQKLEINDSIKSVRLNMLETVNDSILKKIPEKPKSRPTKIIKCEKTIIQHFDSTGNVYNNSIK